MKFQQLPIPPGIFPSKALEADYNPDILKVQENALAWAAAHNLKGVASDPVRISLLIIDAQRDFSFPSGALYVGGRSGTGAMDDHVRLADFIYKNLGVLSNVICTMDTHLPYQIFHPVAHLDEKGNYPAPATMISADDYKSGKYRPNPAMAVQLGADPVWLQKQFIYYCEQLEVAGKYQLTIWPYHCMLGEPGHSLVGAIDEARLFHCFSRGASNNPQIKGGNPLTEHYSIFKPEVLTTFKGAPIPGSQKNVGLIGALMSSNIVIITGQAKSHCLAWSIDDFLTEIKANDPDLAKKVYLLEDCTSPVVIPNVIDFTDQADAAFQRFADEGMNVVKSTDPIESWPGIQGLL